MSWKCIIVEDEYPARLLVKSYVDETPQIELAGDFRDATGALEFLQSNPVDIIFLDIQMPTMTGLEMIRKLPQRAAIILTTAYQDFAIQGFELEVVDYLLKPFTLERFHQAVNRAVSQLDAGLISDQTRMVKTGHEHVKIQLQDILYIEGMREYVRYHTREGSVMELISMKRLEEELPSPQFRRVHKSYIVNRVHIDGYSSGNIQIGEVDIPVGKSYKPFIQQWLISL